MNPDIPIVVIGYNRPASLQRLLESLAAADYEGPVKLYISIDGGKGEEEKRGREDEGKRGGFDDWGIGRGDEVVRIAEDFEWKFGEKIIIRHEQNLGLREHVLRCGDLSSGHDALVALEDDLVVSPRFYAFALQAYQFYKDDGKIGGISLYHHAYNETAQFPFIPLADGSDVFFLQYASSWGQVWTKKHWKGFREWYDHAKDAGRANELPPNIRLWPENSWKKYFIEYLIAHDLYFVYPRVSFTTIFGDEGTNIRIRETFLQVPLFYGKRAFQFANFSESTAIYDTWCEILPECLKRTWKAMAGEDFEVDLYGMKSSGVIKSPKIISGRRCHNPVRTFGRELKPQEENLIREIPGDYFHFGKKEDFSDFPYLVRLLKCHEKKELAYWYPIREYHFYRNHLLVTRKSSHSPLNPGFIFRKFTTTAHFAFRYFRRKK